MPERRLNFGSAHDRVEGFENVDAMYWDGNTDIMHDMTDFPYPFNDNSIEEIRSVESLEHVSFKLTEKIIKEWYRMLKEGGKLYIQVPDAGKAMEYYVNHQICSCCAHKPRDIKDAHGKLDCPLCEGKGMIHPNRWLYTFLGAQKHPFDAHLAIFTEDIMKKHLIMAGFKNIHFKFDQYGWKIKVSASK